MYKLNMNLTHWQDSAVDNNNEHNEVNKTGMTQKKNKLGKGNISLKLITILFFN